MSECLLDVNRLSDPVYVGQAMMRGEIAKLTPAHVQTIYGDEVCEMVKTALGTAMSDIDAAELRMARCRNIIGVLVVLHMTVGLGITALAMLT